MNRSEILQIAKPILFNTYMVRAILENRKTATRRVIKFPVNKYTDKVPDADNISVYSNTLRSEWVCFREGSSYCFDIKPPVNIGDYLYVRETWREHSLGFPGIFIYRADYKKEHWPKMGFKPSIHMPKEAARIFLRVTNVRVERLKDITNEQTIKEGFEGVPCSCVNGEYIFGRYSCTDCMGTGWIEPPQVGFMEIWDSTIPKKDLDKYGWNASPWVWVIEFERVEVE